MAPVSPDVLGEDRLLWEFWLNHGLDGDALRRRLQDLSPDANGDYLAANSLYGGFEGDLLRLLEREGGGLSSRAPLLESARRVAAGAAPRVTLETSEGRLLALLSLRPPPGSPIAREAEIAASRVTSWSAFHRAAGRANLVTAVAPVLAAGGLSGIAPVDTRRALARSAEGILSRNRRLLALLSRLLDAFAAADLAPILLKESALQRLVYLGDGDRMIGDLDILFSEDQIDEADRIIASMGYVSFEGIWSKAWYRAHHHHLAPLVSAAEAVKIEPHQSIWIPSGPAAPILSEMIAASRPHPRLRAKRPSPTHLLFHLLVDLHGNVSIGKLGQAADAAALLRAEGKEIEPIQLELLARRTGATPFVEDSLVVLSRAYGAGFLEESCPGLQGLLPRGAPRLEHAWLRRLSLMHLCGYEPAASSLSLPGVRLLHKALLRPGGRASRIAFLLRGLSGATEGEEGMGAIARKSRGSRLAQLGRLGTFPFRFVARAARSRRRR